MSIDMCRPGLGTENTIVKRMDRDPPLQALTFYMPTDSLVKIQLLIPAFWNRA